MAFLPIYRLVTLSVVLFFSLITIALSAHLTWTTTTDLSIYFVFAAMSIAVGALCVLTFPVMIAIDFTRKGAFTSLVVVELSWLSVVWVLWLAAAALSAEANVLNFAGDCGNLSFSPALVTACREFAGIEAFAFLNWLILMAYTIVLLTFAIIGATRGHKVWTGTVSETQFLAPRGDAGMNPAMQTYAPSGPVTPQYPQQQQPIGQPGQAPQQYQYAPQMSPQPMQPQMTGGSQMPMHPQV